MPYVFQATTGYCKWKRDFVVLLKNCTLNVKLKTHKTKGYIVANYFYMFVLFSFFFAHQPNLKNFFLKIQNRFEEDNKYSNIDRSIWNKLVFNYFIYWRFHLVNFQIVSENEHVIPNIVIIRIKNNCCYGRNTIVLLRPKNGN